MVGKRKANAMMEQITKMAKQNNEEKEEHGKETKAAIGDGWRTETKEEYFDRVLKSSSSLDRVLEFLRFRKQADRLLPSVGNELVALVRRELEIDTALQTLKLETRIASGEGTPILDALGAKRGTYTQKHKNTQNTSTDIEMKNKGKTRKHIKHMTKLKITKKKKVNSATEDEKARKTQKHVKHK